MSKLSTAVYLGAGLIAAYYTWKIAQAASEANKSFQDYLKSAPTSVPGAGVAYNAALAIGSGIKQSFDILTTPDPMGTVANVTPATQAAADAISNGAPYVPQTHPYGVAGDPPQSASGPTTQSSAALTGAESPYQPIPLGY